MDYYGPKAYDYLRKRFNGNLPHISTIRKWYANSGANGEPGISEEGIHTISEVVKEMQSAGEEFYCSIAFDEMYIRRHIQYNDSQKKFSGSITYGNLENDTMECARCAIVFMVVGINKQIALPIAHHFIGTLNTKQKAELLKSIIMALTEANAIIVNVTCDGLSTNFSTFSTLGASFKTENLKPYFLNPANGSKIHIMLDACHMLKLVRNCVHNKGQLEDGENMSIEWAHFQRLEEARVQNELVTHKLTKKHIQCDRNEMSVSLAAQTLSKSVANSLDYLMKVGEPGFENCSGTVKYCFMFNDLFDVLNTGHSDTLSKNKNNILKIPICDETVENIFSFMDDCCDYIKSLKFDGKPILKTAIKTGYLGFLIDVISVKSIFNDYVKSGKIANLATFRLSQDLLEAFFSRIRSKCGSNNNPTVDQFKSAYRKILINNEITSSEHSNCLDRLKIYFIPSTRKSIENHTETPLPTEYPPSSIEPFTANDNILDALRDATICQIASEIEYKIRSAARFGCNLCLNIFDENDKVVAECLKNGHLRLPCISTAHICKVASKYLDIFMTQFKYNYPILLDSILREIDNENMFSGSNFEHHFDHKMYFIQFIAEEYIRIKATYIAKNLTLKEQEKMMRNKLNKAIHFVGQ